MATVYAVASAKGGVGKTTTTAAIATILAEAGADVVAIDADVGMANLADALGMVPGETTVHDVLAGRADPTEAVHDGPAGLRVVPGDPDLDAYAAADPTELGGVIEAFADADWVFLDSGAGLSHDSTLPIGLADETLLVSTPDRSALGDTEKTRQLAERIGGRVAGAAITRVGGDEDESTRRSDPDGAADAGDPTVDIVEEILATEVLARVPEDPTVARASSAGEPLTTFDPDAPASRAYRELARTLTDVDVEEPEPMAADPVADTDEDDAADEDAEIDERLEDDVGDEVVNPADEDDAADDAVAGAEDALIADAEDADDGDDGVTDADATIADTEDADDGDDGVTDADATIADTEDADDDEAAGVDEPTEDSGDANGPDLIEEAEPSPGGSAETNVDDDSERSQTDADPAAGDHDVDDEDAEDDLAGSVPFRDDDTGTMETALTGADDPDRDANDDDTGDDDRGKDDRAENGPEGDDEGDGKDGDGGFFSRLLGR
ncbi:P-loop NTPase [Halorubrum rubrum]|uniref:P-loop NTPase n=1 Tax=Halorubrum rubrum TaxID=1126240 RepID=A0ABD5R4C9_9EURY|nr:P-loop NTPase [Halorubrum rubrum]